MPNLPKPILFPLEPLHDEVGWWSNFENHYHGESLYQHKNPESMNGIWAIPLSLSETSPEQLDTAQWIPSYWPYPPANESSFCSSGFEDSRAAPHADVLQNTDIGSWTSPYWNGGYVSGNVVGLDLAPGMPQVPVPEFTSSEIANNPAEVWSPLSPSSSLVTTSPPAPEPQFEYLESNTWLRLLCRMLSTCPRGGATIRQIYDWFETQTNKTAGRPASQWKSIVRSHLSKNDAFEWCCVRHGWRLTGEVLGRTKLRLNRSARRSAKKQKTSSADNFHIQFVVSPQPAGQIRPTVPCRHIGA